MLAGRGDGGVGGGMFGDALGLGGLGGGDDDEGDLSGTGTGSALGGAGMGMISSFLPTVTGMLQQAMRRVTVKVEWELSSGNSRDLSIVQYVVHPTQGPLQLLQQVNAATEQAEQLGLGEDGDTKTQGGKP